MREQTLKRAILIHFVIIILLTAIVSSVLSSVFLVYQEEKQVRQLVEKSCERVAYQYNQNQSATHLSEILGGNRVTILTQEGNVLDDSTASPESMEYHGDRSEIKNAKKHTVTTDSRTSRTLGHPYMYGAIVLDDGNILRVAHEYSGVLNKMFKNLPATGISFVLVVLLALLITGRFIRKIVTPLEDFTTRLSSDDYHSITEENGYYELNKITNRIELLMDNLQRATREIEKQNQTTKFILSNMSEGVVFLDSEANITLMNRNAEEIFEVDGKVVGHSFNLMTQEENLVQAVQKALKLGQFSVIDMTVGKGVYTVHISPVEERESKDIQGATLFLVNIGKERESQQQRTEFFSNASHELKTPITSVLGFSEMLLENSIPEERKPIIYKHLVDETRRMNNLISDILTISRLESGVVQEEYENVPVHKVAGEAVEHLQEKAKVQQVQLNLKNTPAFVLASEQQIRTLFINLIENAIKYNKENGSVVVQIEKQNGQVDIRVKDTGIGITPEAQKRIFERFYRVDSGRAKTTGGSGLGLSIVKHVVMSLKGTINLESEPKKGTTITVSLPLWDKLKNTIVSESSMSNKKELP